MPNGWRILQLNAESQDHQGAREEVINDFGIPDVRDTSEPRDFYSLMSLTHIVKFVITLAINIQESIPWFHYIGIPYLSLHLLTL
jgi:hypothetical protein